MVPFILSAFVDLLCRTERLFIISPFELVLETRQATTELPMDHVFDLGTTRHLTFSFSHCLQFFNKTSQHNSHKQAKDEEL